MPLAELVMAVEDISVGLGLPALTRLEAGDPLALVEVTVEELGPALSMQHSSLVPQAISLDDLSLKGKGLRQILLLIDTLAVNSLLFLKICLRLLHLLGHHWHHGRRHTVALKVLWVPHRLNW